MDEDPIKTQEVSLILNLGDSLLPSCCLQVEPEIGSWYKQNNNKRQPNTYREKTTTITKKQLRGSGPTGRGLHHDVIISISVFRVLKRHCAVMSQILRSWLEQRCREWAQPVSEGSSRMFWNSAESWLPWQHPTHSKSLPHSTSKNNKTNQRKRIMTKISFMK